MNTLTENITRKVEEIISSDAELFLVEVDISLGRSPKIDIVLDGDQGVPIDRCAEVSRELGMWIEEENLMEGAYLLNVGSPGLDTPLKLHRQYKKNEGRELKVKTDKGEEITGTLVKVEEDHIVLSRKKTRKEPETDIQIKIENIISTKVQVSFK